MHRGLAFALTTCITGYRPDEIGIYSCSRLLLFDTLNIPFRTPRWIQCGLRDPPLLMHIPARKYVSSSAVMACRFLSKIWNIFFLLFYFDLTYGSFYMSRVESVLFRLFCFRSALFHLIPLWYTLFSAESCMSYFGFIPLWYVLFSVALACLILLGSTIALPSLYSIPECYISFYSTLPYPVSYRSTSS